MECAVSAGHRCTSGEDLSLAGRYHRLTWKYEETRHYCCCRRPESYQLGICPTKLPYIEKLGGICKNSEVQKAKNFVQQGGTFQY